MRFGPCVQGLSHLGQGIDVAGALKNRPTEYGQSSPGGDMKAIDAKTVRNLDDNGKGKGGMLCCLFFKKAGRGLVDSSVHRFGPKSLYFHRFSSTFQRIFHDFHRCSMA